MSGKTRHIIRLELDDWGRSEVRLTTNQGWWFLGFQKTMYYELTQTGVKEKFSLRKAPGINTRETGVMRSARGTSVMK